MDTRSAIREIKNAVLEQYQKGLPLETMVAEAQTRIEAKGVGVESARMLSLTVVPALCAAFEERAPSPGKRSSMIETLSAENVAGYAIGAGLLGGFIFAQWKWLGVGGGSLVGVVLAIGAGVLTYRVNMEGIGRYSDMALEEAYAKKVQEDRDSAWGTKLAGAATASILLTLVVLCLLLFATNPGTGSFMMWRAKEFEFRAFGELFEPPERADKQLFSLYATKSKNGEPKLFVGLLNHFFEIKPSESKP